MTVNELKKFATDVRIETVKCLEARTFGHIGGCLSIADVLTVLYNGELKNIDPADPKKLDRDMLVVSKGHAGPAVFATLALKGYFPLIGCRLFAREGQDFQVIVTESEHLELMHLQDHLDRDSLLQMDLHMLRRLKI